MCFWKVTKQYKRKFLNNGQIKIVQTMDERLRAVEDLIGEQHTIDVRNEKKSCGLRSGTRKSLDAADMNHILQIKVQHSAAAYELLAQFTGEVKADLVLISE